ncbi:MAG TPA: methyltransferase domain-containing protein [Xanthomonadales bacterium]|nr:methyltransferase domain-containing protein [Xanthomonadales bacterium]
MPELILRDAAFGDGATTRRADQPMLLTVAFDVAEPVAFDVDVSVELLDARGTQAFRGQLRGAGWDPSWLPRGAYRCHVLAPRLDLPDGDYELHAALWHAQAGETRKADATRIALRIEGGGTGHGGPQASWQLESVPGTVPIDALSWRRGAQDWFHKHFDHAARTVASYMLGDSPLLAGRVLDVGCGDGITDVGLAARWRPREFVGIDPFRGYERLPQILANAHFPADGVPGSLRFLPADANAIPFPDDHFDVVVSWGSLEHIVGGYERALAEIRRVLRRDGLLFVHPGLYYSDIGNHLGEFEFARREPYVHLKRSREELRELVLSSQPDYIDRAGDFATPEQYWQWHTELNPITVPGFEATLRAAGFEPWRVALRTHDRVDYTPELQRYSFVDLAVGELYVSAYNRKP